MESEGGWWYFYNRHTALLPPDSVHKGLLTIVPSDSDGGHVLLFQFVNTEDGLFIAFSWTAPEGNEENPGR